jgi:hypothetical protein
MNLRRKAGALERASFRSRWRDGSVDLLGGLGVVAVGAGWQAGLFWAPVVVAPALIAVWASLRKYVVEPRIGRVVFRQERRDRETRGTRNALLLGFLSLAAVGVGSVVEINSSAGIASWKEEWIGALPCVLVAVLSFLTAALTDVPRFALHAGILVITALIATPVGLEPGLQLIVAGAVVFLIGLYLFLRFLARSAASLPEGLD